MTWTNTGAIWQRRAQIRISWRRYAEAFAQPRLPNDDYDDDEIHPFEGVLPVASFNTAGAS